jgi:hypothetical protein
MPHTRTDTSGRTTHPTTLAAFGGHPSPPCHPLAPFGATASSSFIYTLPYL